MKIEIKKKGRGRISRVEKDMERFFTEAMKGLDLKQLMVDRSVYGKCIIAMNGRGGFKRVAPTDFDKETK